MNNRSVSSRVTILACSVLVCVCTSLLACGSPLAPSTPDAIMDGGTRTVVDAGNNASVDAGPHADAGVNTVVDAGSLPDPFAPQADTSEGLTNTGTDLLAVLEQGALEDACAVWDLDRTNRHKKLLCGKSMFFYEGFGAIGVPQSLLEFFGNRFPTVSGTAWSGIGMVPDPNHAKLPLGVAPGAPIGSVATYAFTCAACHFAQLPDGRYSVGAPNHGYDYGQHILAISLPASSVAPGFNAANHNPDAIAKAQPYIDALAADRALRFELLFQLLPLLGAQQPNIDVETEGHYANWLTGTLDFMMAPLPLDDGVHTVSKITSLWGMATPDDVRADGMPNELLAWTGGAESLIAFLDGFVAIGDGTHSEFTHERLSPLQEYLLSLRAPQNPTPPPGANVTHGRAVFASAGCIACHDGPRGMGRHTYPYADIGTDDAMKAWGDKEQDSTYCCGLTGTPTHELKSPRLVGLWAQKRFLHNGSVGSLEELLCLSPRTPSSLQAQGSDGHTFGCALSTSERADLVAFLRSL
jgi:mono/diheme cytochrome c family protein